VSGHSWDPCDPSIQRIIRARHEYAARLASDLAGTYPSPCVMGLTSESLETAACHYCDADITGLRVCNHCGAPRRARRRA
jgi:hypothetical protein